MTQDKGSNNMTENRAAPPASAGRMQCATGTVLLVAGLLLAGCSANQGPGASRQRTFAVDLAGGAKLCDIPKVTPVLGKTADAAIKVGNDGGWCGIGVQQDGAKPFGAGLLMTRPNHGTVTIHAVGDDTRIDYTPDRGFSGRDGFAVKLIPGDARLNVDVTVTPSQS
jgi:hypothetical protein